MTMYQSIYSDDLTILVEKKADLRKALKKVFGDTYYIYLDNAVNTGNEYYIVLNPYYAYQVYDALGGKKWKHNIRVIP